MKIIDLMQCGDCHGKAIYRHGYYVCPKCGLVLERAYIADADGFNRSEVLMKAPLPPYECSTVFKRKQQFSSTAELERYRRLKRAYTRRLKSYERHRQRVIKSLEAICLRLHLSKPVINEVINIYLRAMAKRLIGSKEAVAKAAAIYLGCNIAGEPRFWQEICDAIGEPQNSEQRKKFIISARRTANKIREVLGLPYTPENPAIYLPRIVRNTELLSAATDFIHRYWKKHHVMSGHMPNVVAGATVVYLAKKKGIPVDISWLSKQLHTTEVSIRKVEREFENYKL